MAPEKEPALVLLVEDEAAVREAYHEALAERGHRVIATDLVASAWSLFTARRPALAIIDLTLPDGSGLDLCAKVRGNPELALTPLIILTSRSGLEDKKRGFEVGADQYLVKPLPPPELVLWTDALLRRSAIGEADSGVLHAGDCEVDAAAHVVRYKGAAVSDLTRKEFELLHFLVRNRPKVLSRQHILSRLWRVVCVDQVVDTHLARMRKKLPPELADRIQSVPGRGFRFVG
ncbi:MAG: response regulator transcription factor [Elusimicrobia bacterium]|nr:response regulator transcription factor [Elusimicrobiota bacterium]